jgi:hypothetical protein
MKKLNEWILSKAAKYPGYDCSINYLNIIIRSIILFPLGVISVILEIMNNFINELMFNLGQKFPPFKYTKNK